MAPFFNQEVNKMVVGISYILLGILNLFLFKEKHAYIFKLQGYSFLISGIGMSIVWFINLFVNSKWLLLLQGIIILIAISYDMYKLNQWYVATQVMDKLTKK